MGNLKRTYKLGTQFTDNTTNHENLYTIGVVINSETEATQSNNRTAKDEKRGIGLITPSGTHYSHLIRIENYEGVVEITSDEFRKITANTYRDFDIFEPKS